MLNERKRREGAVAYTFDFYGCAPLIQMIDGKTYVYEAVLTKLAKNISGYTQPTYSLYRDLHRAESARDIRGMRAVCIEDFNAENFLCKINLHVEKGKDKVSY